MLQSQHIHFIGIGGSGMNGIAGIMKDLGYRVSGSDMKASPTIERLESLGITCYCNHAAEHLGDTDMVVASTAIPPDNVELVAARERGIPLLHRSEMLAWLMSRQKGIAVAGAHGKTTTTSMTALTMEKNGLDPTIIIGGELTEIGGNAKLGGGQYLVAEADESDGSFLRLDPFVEIITNIEDDHLDYYKNLKNIVDTFWKFMQKVPHDGLAVLCLDDPHLRKLVKKYKRPFQTYALSQPDADYTLRKIKRNGAATSGDVFWRGEKLGRLELSVPGVHNLSNALAVVAACRFAGLEFDDVACALKPFKGAGRRFQLLGEVNGIRVVDDYAHHPTEIQATLRAASQVKAGRVISVFQPHRYTRTSLLWERFGEVFSDADLIIVNDIYSAGEKPIEGVSARLIISAIEKHEGRDVIHLPGREETVDFLAREARPGDLVLTMGAGDVWTAGAKLVQRLKGES